MSFLVHLRLPDVEQESGGLVFDVGEVEGDEFGAADGGGVAEQDDRGVADAVRGGAVDAADDLPEGSWRAAESSTPRGGERQPLRLRHPNLTPDPAAVPTAAWNGEAVPRRRVRRVDPSGVPVLR
jgi:hypothetical protein